jgi:hypothetical protein
VPPTKLSFEFVPSCHQLSSDVIREHQKSSEGIQKYFQWLSKGVKSMPEGARKTGVFDVSSLIKIT